MCSSQIFMTVEIWDTLEPPKRGCGSAGHPSQRERDRKRENERVRGGGGERVWRE